MMYRFSLTAALAGAFIVASACGTALGQQSQRIGTLRVLAGEIVFKKQQWVLSGSRPRLYSSDGRFDIRADKIVVDFAPRAAGAKVSKESIASVTATGSVQITSKTAEQSAAVRAPKAVYTQADGTIVLSGGVSGTVEDPSLEEPTPISADRVTVWLNATGDGPRLKVEGSPAELKVTPKPRARPEQPAPQGKPAAKS